MPASFRNDSTSRQSTKVRSVSKQADRIFREESWTDESFANSPTRIVKLAETTKATNSIFGTGGDLGRVPDFAVTIGMKEILSARRIHVFLDWHWQRFVLRRTLLGPVSRTFPASFLQTHKDVRFTVTQEIATPHSLVPE